MPHKYSKSTASGGKENITKPARFSNFSWLFLMKQLYHLRLLDTNDYSQRESQRTSKAIHHPVATCACGITKNYRTLGIG